MGERPSKSHPLAKPRQRLDRAEAHALLLNDEVRAFLATEPYTYAYEIHRNVGEQRARHVYRGRIKRDIPDHWPGLLAECLFNLRSSLDQLIWRLALEHDGPPARPRRVEFPVYRTARSFEREGRAKVACINPDAQAIVEDLQPYKDPSTRTDHHWLWKLHSLSNLDKHRAPHITAVVLQQATWHLNKESPSFPDAEFRGGPFVDGAELAAYTFTGPAALDPDLKVEMEPKFSVGIKVRKRWGWWPLEDQLLRLCCDVEQEAFARLAPFLF